MAIGEKILVSDQQPAIRPLTNNEKIFKYALSSKAAKRGISNMPEIKYKLFTTPTCPNCPKVKEFVKTLSIPGEIINAATTEGAVLAAKFGIMAVPTILFFNKDNEVIEKAQSVPQVRKVVDSLVATKILQ